MKLQVSESATMPPVSRNNQRTSSRPVVWFIYLLSAALLVWAAVDGFSYYTTPFAERPHHEDYRELRPAGTTGLMFGYAGAAMMVLMLVYSVRKRTALLGRKLSLQSMLNFHIYLGIMGPLLIVLHTSFKVQGLVAVSFWSMVAVAASGFFGRYLYLQIPRNIQGTELTLVELERLTGEVTSLLRERFKFDEHTVAKLDGVIARFSSGTQGGAWQAVITLVVSDLFRWRARQVFVREVARVVLLPHREFRELTRIAFERALLKRRIEMLAQVHQIFHYWHVIHKPFAIIMYVIMLVHIGVAIWTGYGWVW